MEPQTVIASIGRRMGLAERMWPVEGYGGAELAPQTSRGRLDRVAAAPPDANQPHGARPIDSRQEDASYARNVRGRTGLTQAAFAARIGVPVETVRNWEQGKRSPRGPARALLKVIEQAPEAAFAVLGKTR